MKFKYVITAFLSSILLGSCNYLDFDETNGLKTKEDMYKYFNTTKGMLTHVYSYIPQDFGAIGNAMRDCASDDAEFGTIGATVQNFNNGNWSPIKTTDTAWNLYNGVRAANAFIKDIAEADFSRYEYDGTYENNMRQLKYFPYEAKVLRAFFFFELARRYGDIAMPLEVLSTDEANSIAKTPFKEVIKFIVETCNEAAAGDNLPESYANEPGAEIGRITKGFAMALKSKALLYAASALHNPSMDTELWKTSAKAALDLIKTGIYSLSKSETANNLTSKEAVLMRANSENSNFELYNFPIRFVLGKRPSANISNSTFPSQNLVDAFETVNGYPVTLGTNGWVCEDPAFDPLKPYENRDPRFYRTVLANGMEFKGSTIETFVGGADDVPVSQGGSPTGYFLRKYIQPSTSFATDQEVKAKHHWVIYRYAETLLTYAESMVCAFKDPKYTSEEFDNKSAEWALNEVRVNAGMPPVNISDPNEFLRALQNEWRVEFAFEDHRFWDVRRWKIGYDTQRLLYGVRIVNESGNLRFYRNLYENRMWKECMNLYPIPQNELFKNPNLNPQNPEW